MLRNRKKLLLCMTVGLCLALVLAGSDVYAYPGVGDPAEDFTLEDTDGNWHTLSDYEGQVVFMFIFTSW